jgi:hypothetical protein
MNFAGEHAAVPDGRTGEFLKSAVAEDDQIWQFFLKVGDHRYH